jgi:DNA primase
VTLTPAFLDELRARTPLSALIGKTVKLTRAGRESKGCCPFHQEKTPSFYVNDDKGFYHCFGCSAHGDAIRWMTDQRGLPFMDAVKELAGIAGLDVPAPSARDAERVERQKTLGDAMEAAQLWFRQQLRGLDGAEARALLERRGVSEETARAFGFGYAPEARGRLRTALKEFGDALLIEAGLLISVDGKEPYDRFRGRLTIPIRDARARVIAFGGRVIGDGEPKYLNSPDTPLFDKGRTLFNLDKALAPARKADRVIVVEGYMDAVALAQAGVGEVVAPLGTALTEAQLERLWRIADVPLVCLDGDAAGQKAALRAATRALPMLAPGRSLAFVTLPEGQDPDDLVRKQGVAAFERCAGAAEPLVERLWKHELAAEPLDTPEQRAGLRQRLNALADTIAEPSVKAEYRADFRRRFDEQFARSRQSNALRQPFYPYAQRRRGEKWSPPTLPVTDDAKKVRAAGNIDPIMAKAVIAGLIRHPAEIARHMEVLGSLRLGNGALARLFEAVIDVALEDRRGGSLDSGGLVTILARTGFEEIASELLRADTMPYSFTQAKGDERRAREDLDEAIAILIAKPEVDASLAEATAAMQADFTAESFARQVALVNEQRALGERLANLVQATEDARAQAVTELSTEDD